MASFSGSNNVRRAIAQEDSVQDIELARTEINKLALVFPELLKRSQDVAKNRAALLAISKGERTATGPEKERFEKRLSIAERERADLRKAALGSIDKCGSALQEDKMLLTACVTLDNRLLDKPVALAVVDFGRAVPSRRRDMLKTIKMLRSKKNVYDRQSDGRDCPETGEHGSAETELLLLRDHLVKLSVALKQLDKCNDALSKVRTCGYVARFEDARASAQMDRKSLALLLERWCERNRDRGREGSLEYQSLWERHGELVETLLSALCEELNGALIRAVCEDISRFALDPQIFPKEARAAAAAANQAAAAAERNKVRRQLQKQEALSSKRANEFALARAPLTSILAAPPSKTGIQQRRIAFQRQLALQKSSASKRHLSQSQNKNSTHASKFQPGALNIAGSGLHPL